MLASVSKISKPLKELSEYANSFVERRDYDAAAKVHFKWEKSYEMR